ncbi:MAG TPA: protein phosphatase 2C domain-containing protein [Acidimicrobiales bacterium]|nr:protein phosphatase 2C domain-containing protein [Acidimicrobiales bacterium]
MGTATRAGAHGENQDRAATGDGWAVVSDGVGGHAGGARASTLAVDAAIAVLTGSPGDRASVRAAFRAAHAAVMAGQAADPRVAGMAATLVVAVASDAPVAEPGPGDEGWTIGHVGDSPAWYVTTEACRQVTDDHTLAGDLLRSGTLTPDEAASHPTRRFVTRVVGGQDGDQPDVTEVDLGVGDALVLASDGVADALSATRIGALVRAAPTAQDAAATLAAEAVSAGSRDDVTAVVLRRLASSGA